MTTPQRIEVDEEPTIGKLVADTSRDLSALIRGEIELAKSELKISVRAGGAAIGLFAAAVFLILLSNIAIWAFCAGIITRIAAVQLTNKGPVSLKQAVRFVCKRYLGYLGAPLVPLIIIAICALGLAIYGILGLIPFIGDIFIYGLGLPVILLGGAAMAVTHLAFDPSRVSRPRPHDTGGLLR